ncbi:hypothetical protein [Planctomyces sp. SH-PL62]|uniref:hypothetical protein n=1 Tax=Planctomyces sp. SH-PL62 TaxID=1636152 RepID=UPI00078CEE66|nr:hypothetical protein [Planctomyces sp. SH-PL62]AMV40018.1 hypothetical protein VT85_21470 [Planctomyces sp. SH-PL62]
MVNLIGWAILSAVAMVGALSGWGVTRRPVAGLLFGAIGGVVGACLGLFLGVWAIPLVFPTHVEQSDWFAKVTVVEGPFKPWSSLFVIVTIMVSTGLVAMAFAWVAARLGARWCGD